MNCLRVTFLLGRVQVLGKTEAGLASGVWVLLLFVALFGVVLNVPLVWGSGTIYILADGSIDPSDAPISTVDNVIYTLTGNITSDADGIIVERDNLVIDGNGFMLQGSGGYSGIFLHGMENVTVRNMWIKFFAIGVWFRYCSQISISENNITANSMYGIYVNASSYSSISGNGITTSNGYGVFLDSSSENSICGNNITNNYWGIGLSYSSNSRFWHNNFINNTQSLDHSDSSFFNTWDDGYPSGGNYWSDYTDVDEKVCPNQDVPGSDGIGDTPYVIDANNRDCYPLMKPWTPTTSPAVYISVPYHSQINSYYCGPAALEMVFHFYGPDIPQTEIADVARTAPDGTYTCDMVRAAHFSNLSTSVGKEMQENITGYTARKLGYVAFECGGMTIDDLKSLVLAGYPIIVLTTWHFRVVVGYDSNYIIFQDSYYGPMYKMAYNDFDTDWDYSGHWGLFVSPWKVEVSIPNNVSLGSVFNVTASITYPLPPPFPSQYPASMANATVTLPTGLTFVPGENAEKTIDTGDLVPGASANVTWAVRAGSLGICTISVEAEGKVTGFVPPLPSYPDSYNYEDRIGGSSQSVVAVIPSPDNTAPTTSDDYDGLWHTTDFTITLTATDDFSGVAETYYRINGGSIQNVSANGQPFVTREGSNNTLEYWSVDNSNNTELPHRFLSGIKLDKTSPVIETQTRIPSGNVTANQPVTISANVTDALSGVKSVRITYNANNSAIWWDFPMNLNSTTGLYEYKIPGQQVDTLVRYKITAYDNASNSKIDDNSGYYFVYIVVPEFPQFLILSLFMIATLLAVTVYKRKRLV
jgi:parallel beta-helix repeat protein